MGRYLIRRIIQAIPLLLGISLVSFLIMHLAPGGPLSAYLQNPRVSPADIDRLEKLMGLDKPVYEQYFYWLKSLLQGEWGRSYSDGLPVIQHIKEKLPYTVSLMGLSFLISISIAIPAGIFSAVKRYSFFDYLVTVASFFGLAMPSFWFGMMLQLAFALGLGWLPTAGSGTIGIDISSGFFTFILDRVKYLIMPTIVLGLINIASWSRYMRSSMLEALHQDYIRTALSKGVSKKTVIFKHALRNALIPVVTIMGLDLPAIFSGAAITESIFAWPGMGRLYVGSIGNRDYPVLMGVLMLTAVLVVAGNLIADIAYGFLDPRIKYD